MTPWYCKLGTKYCSDEFELKFPKLSQAELKGFRAKSTRVKQSWGISIFELKFPELSQAEPSRQGSEPS